MTEETVTTRLDRGIDAFEDLGRVDGLGEKAAHRVGHRIERGLPSLPEPEPGLLEAIRERRPLPRSRDAKALTPAEAMSRTPRPARCVVLLDCAPHGLVAPALAAKEKGRLRIVPVDAPPHNDPVIDVF